MTAMYIMKPTAALESYSGCKSSRVSSAEQREERHKKKIHKGYFSVLNVVWVYKLVLG